MDRTTALSNASAVWQFATLFGYGRTILLKDLKYYVSLSMTLPYSDFDVEREKERFSHIVICGAEFRVDDYPSDKLCVLRIEWPIDQKNV